LDVCRKWARPAAAPTPSFSLAWTEKVDNFFDERINRISNYY